MRSRVELLIAVLLTLLAVHLHVVFLLDAGALWRDEVNSVDFARMPLPVAWHNLQFDSFPMLSTVLLRGWGSIQSGGGAATPSAGPPSAAPPAAPLAAAITRTDRWFRIYGFVIGLCFLAAVWITCRLLGGRGSPPLLSLALVGMAPWAIQAIDSIRPYGPGIVLIVLAAGFVWRVASTPRSAGRGAASAARVAVAAVFAILSVQAMYQNAFLLLAICVAGVVAALQRSDRGAAVTVLAVGASAALSLLPYLHSVAAAREWNPLVQRPTGISWLFTVFSQATTPEGSVLGSGIFLVIWIALVVVCVIVGVGAIRARRAPSEPASTANPALYCGVLVVAAMVFYFAGLMAAKVRTEPWYYVPLMALLAPAVDVVIAGATTGTAAFNLRRRKSRTPAPRMFARPVIAMAVAAVTIWPAWIQLSKPRTSMDSAAGLISREAAPADLVVVFPFFYGVSFQRYYHGTAPWISVPPIDDLRIHRYDLVKQRLMEPTETMAPVFARMSETMKSGHNVWIVGSLPPPDAGVRPVDLPPAPAAGGWNCGPYLHVWGQEVAQFLEDHATRGRIAQGLSNGKVNFFEDVPVTVPSGWKEAPATRP